MSVKFVETLEGVLKESTETRKMSSDALDGLSPEEAIGEFVAVMTSSSVNADIRRLAAVLMKRKLSQARWDLPPESNIRNNIHIDVLPKLLAALQNDSDFAVRKRLVDLIAALAGHIFFPSESKAWACVWEFVEDALFSSHSSYTDEASEAKASLAFTLLSRLSEYSNCVPQLEIRADSIITVITQCIDDFPRLSGTAFTSAIELFVSLLESLDVQSANRTALRLIGAKALRTVAGLCLGQEGHHMTGGSEYKYLNACQKCLEELINATDLDPCLWTAAMPVLTEQTFCILDNPHLDICLRNTGLQLLIGAFVKNSQWLLENQATNIRVVDLLFTWIADLPDDESEWAEVAEEDVSEPGLHKIGIEAVARMCNATRSEIVVPTILTKVGIVCTNWERASSAALFSALSLLQCAVLGHPDEVHGRIPEFESVIMNLATHSMGRVRFGTLSLVAAMFESYGPKYQRERLPQIIDLLVNAIVTETQLRLKVQALTTLLQCLLGLDEADNESVAPYADPLIQQVLTPAMQHPNTVVKERALACASALVTITAGTVAPYYSDFVPFLLNIIQNDRVESMRTQCDFRLSEAAIDLFGNLSVAVGIEMLDRAAVSVAVENVSAIHDFISTDATAAYRENLATVIIRTYSQLAELMGEEFSPYLTRVMPRILESLAVEAKMEFSESSGGCGGGWPSGGEVQKTEFLLSGGSLLGTPVTYSEEDGVTKIALGRASASQCVVTINSCAVETKMLSISAAGTFAKHLPTGTAPYIQQLLHLVTADLKCHFVLLRKAVHQALPSLVRCAMESNYEGIAQTAITALLPQIIDGVNSYTGSQVVEYVLPCIEEMVEVVGGYSKRKGADMRYVADSSGISNKMFYEFGKLVVRALSDELENLGVKSAGHRQLNFADDQDESEEDENVEGRIYDGVMQCSTTALKFFKELCYDGFMTHLHTAYAGLLAVPNANLTGKVASMCVLGYVIEHGGSGAISEHAPNYLPVALHYVKGDDREFDQLLATDDDAMMLQAAAFGIGVVATRDRQTFSPHIHEAVQALERLLMHPGVRSEGNRMVADCAVCALLKIYSNYEDFLGTERCKEGIKNVVHNWLPFEEDLEEAQVAHDILTGLITSGSHLLSMETDSGLVRKLIEVFTLIDRDARFAFSETTRSEEEFAIAKRMLASFKV